MTALLSCAWSDTNCVQFANSGTREVTCFAIRKWNVQKMNKEGPTLAFYYLSGCYVFNSIGVVAIIAAATCGTCLLPPILFLCSWFAYFVERIPYLTLFTILIPHLALKTLSSLFDTRCKFLSLHYTAVHSVCHCCYFNFSWTLAVAQLAS
jgi:hypothetical protein